MNWYDILKVQTQSQRQGFRLDDKDEDYVLEDEEETCYEKLVKLLIQQEGFEKGTEGEGFVYLSRYIEDISVEMLLYKNHEDELYCWLVEKESLYPGKMASGFASALNRALGSTNPNIDRRRTFKIGDISVYGGSVFYPRESEPDVEATFEERFDVEGDRPIIWIKAFKIKR